MKVTTGIAAAIFFLTASVVHAGDRFPERSLDEMTPDQRRVAEAILSGPRKTLVYPFHAWLRSPELADRLQKLGEYLRFNTSLPLRLNELAILVGAREWTSQFEWYAHHALAMKAGLDPKIAEAIAEGKRPENMQEDEQIVYDFSMQLHRTRAVTDEIFKAAIAKFGEQGVMDLIAVNGYYDLVSMTLNVVDAPVPAGVEPPLKPLEINIRLNR